ncbi:MAG TPA: cation:dicarboxylase symporter family transporter, partial [Brevundimonas sp.]|nr:cation:dicarboxylase symporter family transporter [Brevundimonas sp.]
MAASRLRSALKSLSLWVMIALLAGLFAGAAAQAVGLPGGEGTATLIASIGSLWLNALKMTIIPLVFSLLVTGIASIADAASTGRLALKALLVFGLLLLGAVIYAFLASEGLHMLWPISPEGARILLSSAPDASVVIS